MRSILRKGVDITPRGVIQPGSLQDYRVVRQQPWWRRLKQSTSHLRLWADWPTLHPKPEVPIDSEANPGYPNLLALDEQIRLAGEDGLKVIVMPYRYPTWSNGTAHIDPSSTDNLLFHTGDRTGRERFFDWWDRRGTPEEAEFREVLRLRMKALVYRLPPEGHGPDSYWGRYVDFLWQRYVAQAPRYGRAHYFEVTNEPNLQLWPQRSASGTPDDPLSNFEVAGTEMTIHRPVAEMMLTMDTIADRYGGRVICLAPSHSDAGSRIRQNPRLTSVFMTTPYWHVDESFVDGVLDELDRLGFAASRRWGWSFHSYNDVELNEIRVVTLRKRLAGRWRGRQLDGGAALYCTETGCRLSRVRELFGEDLPADEQRRLQGKILKDALWRHHIAREEGSGVALLTQYTITADPNYDCGLRDEDGGHRPTFDAWVDVPEVADDSTFPKV